MEEITRVLTVIKILSIINEANLRQKPAGIIPDVSSG
jgi:hypothetical protein